MVTITLQADEALIDALAEITGAKRISLEDAAREALARYVAGEQLTGKPRYSFVGIGHSGASVIVSTKPAAPRGHPNRRLIAKVR